MGVIEEVGDAVQSLKRGDRVVLPFNIACGYCANCHRGHTEAFSSADSMGSGELRLHHDEWSPHL
jgi:glutathione-independent formaldehyde dehydrogenase